MDGLGLVFEQQGNTGAGAYQPPANDMHLDKMAGDLHDEYKIRLQNKLHDDRIKAAAKEKAYNEPVNIAAWDIDMNRELAADATAIKQRMAQLRAEGIDPQDYGNPKSKEYQDLQLSLTNKVASSKQQKDDYYRLLNMIEQDRNSATPQYDYDKSMQALSSYAKALSIGLRSRIQPNSLLVAKPKPFDTYSPLKDFKINDYVGKFGTDTPTGGSSGSTLSKGNLKADMKAMAENPINEEHYQEGVKRGLWNSKEKYADELYKKALRQYTPDYETKIKTPKDGVGLTDDQVNAIINTPPIKTNHAKISMNGYPIKDEKDGQVYTNTTLYNPQSLGGIKLVVPGAESWNLTKGEKPKVAGNYELADGQMAIGLVYEDGSPVEDIGDNMVYRHKDSDGTIRTYTKDQLIEKGYAKYAPIIQGNGQYRDAEGKIQQTPIMVKANRFINTVNGAQSKDMNDAYNKLQVLDKIATKMNSTGEEKSYNIKGQDWPESDVQHAANASGMTVEEYIAEANK